MRDVLLALLFHVGVLLGVVIAVGHAEPALHRLRDVARAVLCILTCAKPEKCLDADRVQMRDFRKQISAVLDAVNALELFFERLRTLGFDCFLVHAAGVVVAHFLCFRRELGID